MPIALILLNLLPVVLRGIPGISDTIKQIITDVSGGATALIGSGVLTQPSVSTALAAWLGVITTLQNDPNLPKESLNALAQLGKAVQAALTADEAAAKLVDWSLIHPISPV